jgi:PAS domain S-box-containing protein
MPDKEKSQSEARDAGARLVAGHVSEDPFAAAFKATRMPMIVTDPNQHDNPIIFCNAAFLRLSGYPDNEVIGRNCRFLQGPDTDPNSVTKIRKAISAGEDVAVDILNYKKDGSSFWNAVFISPVRDDDGKIVYFFASQLDFTNVKSREADLAAARHKAEAEVAKHTAELRKGLAARSLLVHEVDHRVKNNLLTMASIVKMQARVTKDEAQKQALMSVLNRIEALSTVQRKLFTLDDVAKFDMSDFTRELVTDLVGATGRKDIRLSLNLSPVFVPAVKATPLSLIVNEIVGDAVRRGLSDGGGDIHVEVRRTNGHFHIRIEDTSEQIEVDPEAAELGQMLLEASAHQLGARIDRKTENGRTTVEVTLLVDGQEHAH